MMGYNTPPLLLHYLLPRSSSSTGVVSAAEGHNGKTAFATPTQLDFPFSASKRQTQSQTRWHGGNFGCKDHQICPIWTAFTVMLKMSSWFLVVFCLGQPKLTQCVQDFTVFNDANSHGDTLSINDLSGGRHAGAVVSTVTSLVQIQSGAFLSGVCMFSCVCKAFLQVLPQTCMELGKLVILIWLQVLALVTCTGYTRPLSLWQLRWALTP